MGADGVARLRGRSFAGEGGPGAVAFECAAVRRIIERYESEFGLSLSSGGRGTANPGDASPFFGSVGEGR